MLVCKLPYIAFILGFTFVNGIAQSGIHPKGPKNCGDVYAKGNMYEGYYAIYPSPNNLDEAGLVFCGVEDGMLPLNSSSPRSNPKNCQQVRDSGVTESGINVIYPYADHPESPVVVFCEQVILNGGWTVFQRRDDYVSQLDFYKSFEDYALGFGQVGTEHWLGNDILHELTEQSVSELYVDLTSFDDINKYALYNFFHVGPKYNPIRFFTPYQLSVGLYSGTAGNGLIDNNGFGFTTFDFENDADIDHNCAITHDKGGWWYSDCAGVQCCGWSNPNGIYYEDETVDDSAANWYYFSDKRESLKRIVLMTRPLKQQ